MRRQRTTSPAPIVMTLFWFDTMLGVVGVTVTAGLILWAIFGRPDGRAGAATLPAHAQEIPSPASDADGVAEVVRGAADPSMAVRQPVS